MGKNHGKMVYVPNEIVLRVNDIYNKENYSTKQLAFKKMAQYADIGREMERIMKFDIMNFDPYPPIKSIRGRK